MNQKLKNKQSLNQFLMAKENRLGVIVLCIGILALIWVLYSAYNKFSNPIDIEDYYAEQEAEAPLPEYINNQEPEEPKYIVQPNITNIDIEGAWDGQTDNARMLLQLSKGLYKFAYISQDGSKPNIYSMGQYSLNDALLLFQPSNDYRAAAKEFPKYQNLTSSNFPTVAIRKGEKLILQRPDDSHNVYVPPLHRFLKLMPDEVAVFSPLK